MEACSLLDEVFVSLYVVDPYSGTDLTLLLKIRSLVRVYTLKTLPK